jgi:hypothetical protein
VVIIPPNNNPEVPSANLIQTQIILSSFIVEGNKDFPPHTFYSEFDINPPFQDIITTSGTEGHR